MAVRDGKLGGLRKLCSAGCIAVALFLAVGSAHAQLEIGDNLNLKLNGGFGYGYSGSYGNMDAVSSHGSGLTGYGELSGYYFHPNFLNFNVRPYYDRSQSNADSQMIETGSGIGATVDLFSGSHFPGSISYSRSFTTNNQFQFAGAPSISGDSSGQGFTIGWAAYVPNLPQVQANFSTGSTTSSIAGLENNDTSSSKDFTLNGNYTLYGFSLSGTYNKDSNSFNTDNFFLGERLQNTGTSSSYTFAASHALPLSGNFSAGFSHGSYDSTLGGSSSGNSYSAGFGISPWRRVSFYNSVQYTTNVFASMTQSVLDGNVAELRSQKDASGFYWTSGAGMQVFRGLSINGRYSYRKYQLSGMQFEDTQYGATASYSFAHRLFGMLYFGIGVIDNANKAGNLGTGINANVGMNRHFGHWDTSADFNYSQDVMTIGSIATTSSYTYGGTIRRKLNPDTFWSGSFRASHSGVTAQAGTGNAAESFSSSLTWHRYNVFGNYSESRGTAVINAAGGLTATPVGSLISDDFLLFNARGFGVGGSASLFRHFSLSGGYSRFNSDTTHGPIGTWSMGDRYSIRAQYRVRKFQFTGFYNRSEQSLSAVTGGPRVINSFSLSLSRWFNVF